MMMPLYPIYLAKKRAGLLPAQIRYAIAKTWRYDKIEAKESVVVYDDAGDPAPETNTISSVIALQLIPVLYILWRLYKIFRYFHS
jgi:hypothetical protein